MLVGCGVEPGVPDADTDTGESVAAQAWTEVVDGTWAYGDFALGSPNKMRLSEYAITVTATPRLTTTDAGRTVRMASPITVERVEPAGKFHDTDTAIGDSDQFIFVPGNLDYRTHDETYGKHVSVRCPSTPAAVGDITECTIEFIAPAAEIANSYWTINRASMAAWPGQIT